MTSQVTIIGAGLAGLSCARELAAHGVEAEILEASDQAGGRVRTDQHEGFLLDRGFQVLLAAYPECRRQLDYPALRLQSFYPGALVRIEGRFHKLADPVRRPKDAVASLGSPIGTFTDKLRVAGLRTSVMQGSVEQLFERPETTTLGELRARHFSEAMIDRFFRPFFGGIFLDRSLGTSSRQFEFIFRMFAEGDTAVPAAGMQEIPKQLSAGARIQFNTKVTKLPEGTVVVATEEPEAARLLGFEPPEKGRSVQCFYFAADRSPLDEQILVLDGDGAGPVNNFCGLPSYSPPGALLLSASVLGSATESEVRAHLTSWFGAQVARWQHLRTYDITYAQPAKAIGERPSRVRKGLYICGDYAQDVSLNGALVSGRRAAEAVLADLA